MDEKEGEEEAVAMGVTAAAAGEDEDPWVVGECGACGGEGCEECEPFPDPVGHHLSQRQSTFPQARLSIGQYLTGGRSDSLPHRPSEMTPPRTHSEET